MRVRSQAYECSPGNRYVTPKNVNITTANPRMAKYAARRPRQPRVIRICRYPAYTSQVIAAQVSFGSQLQYEPQVRFAQYAPAAIIRVSSGNAIAIVR